MLGLGIDTSTRVGSLALVDDDKLLTDETIDAELNHSANLLPTLEHALEKTGLSQADLHCVGVGVGPGSLTGVRVGIAFAKGLVFALGKPLVGVCSLKAIAYRRREDSEIVSVIVDGKMGGFYLVGYRWNGQAMEEAKPLSVFAAGEVPQHLAAGSLILSPDAGRFPLDLTDRLPSNCTIETTPVFPSAEYIARSAIREVGTGLHDTKKMVEPIYLRAGVPSSPRSPHPRQ